VRIAALTVLTDHQRVIELIFTEELLRTVIEVNVDLAQTVVEMRVLRSLFDTLLNPRANKLKTVASLALQNKILNEGLVAGIGTNAIHKLSNLFLRSVQVKKSTNNLRS